MAPLPLPPRLTNYLCRWVGHVLSSLQTQMEISLFQMVLTHVKPITNYESKCIIGSKLFLGLGQASSVMLPEVFPTYMYCKFNGTIAKKTYKKSCTFKNAN